MHRLLLVLLLLASTAFSYPLVFEKNDPLNINTLQVACKLAKLDCSGIEPATIMLIDTEPALAFHIRNTNVIFLTEECIKNTADDMMCEALLVHEMVHYVHDVLDLYQDDKCANEEIAWRAYNEYVIALDRKDLTRRNWREGYKQCRGG